MTRPCFLKYKKRKPPLWIEFHIVQLLVQCLERYCLYYNHDTFCARRKHLIWNWINIHFNIFCVLAQQHFRQRPKGIDTTNTPEKQTVIPDDTRLSNREHLYTVDRIVGRNCQRAKRKYKIAVDTIGPEKEETNPFTSCTEEKLTTSQTYHIDQQDS